MNESTWTKSTYSGPREPNCVECRTSADRVLIRDTQHRHHGHLEIPTAEWRAFLMAVHTGEL